jgi:hypothetical protein
MTVRLPPHRRRTGDEVEDLLMRIRGLVFVRAILEQRGASAAELDEHRREIERLRRRLARVLADGAGGLDAA